MAKKKESEFEKLARLVKEEGEDIREHLASKKDLENIRREFGGRIDHIEKKMDEGFAAIIRRLDGIIQMQLDTHAARIKKLEAAVFK